MRLGIGVCAAFMMLAGPCLAQDAPPPIRQFDIPTLEKLAHDMYIQDQAAWHGTDALLAAHPQTELLKEKVGGWIVETVPSGQMVRFMRQGDAGLEAAYDISDPTGTPVVSVPQDRHLTDAEKAQFAARTLALKSMTERCGDNFNTIVLKDPQGDGWLAWALQSTHDPNLIMAGGHHRLTVSADGNTVIHMDALSRSCAVMKKAGENGKTLAALVTTQLVSDVPVETFLFLSQQHRLAFYVMTPDRTLWVVEGDKLRNMGNVPYKPKAP